MSKTNPNSSSDFCQKYLRKKHLFKWFIERYFGSQKYIDLWEMAEKNEEQKLKTELESIWYDLPDNIFNIQNNPPGWDAFVSLIDE